jgi:hypothetical protein
VLGSRRPATRALAALVAQAFALLFLGLPGASPAAAATRAPDPYYGVWYDGLSPSPQEARAHLDRQAAAGIGLVRQYVWWDRMETRPGVYDWSRFDQLIADTSARRMTVLPTLLYTPSFYSSKPPGSTSTAQFPPSDPETMARFAEAMVRRYGPGGTFWQCSLPTSCRTPYTPIRAWEVWNEPDYPSWWKNAPNPEEYVPLLRAVSTAIHRADPGAEVVLGALTNSGASAQGGYLDRLYELGAGQYFDTITINPYAHNVADMVGFVRGARAIATEHGDATKPIRITEYGWGSGSEYGWPDGTARRLDRFTTDACHGALMHAGTQRLAQLRTDLGIRSIIEFQWQDVATTSKSWPHYAGLLRADGSAKPALGAITEAIAERPAPAGLSLAEACTGDHASRQPDVVVSGGVADDSFSRTTDGWGSARTGGAYTLEGTSSDFEVSGGAGRMRVGAGQSRAAVLASTSAGNVDAVVTFSTDKQASLSQHVAVVARRVEAGTEYRVRATLASNGAVRLALVRVVDGVETVVGGEVTVPGLTHVAGQPITLRARLTGSSPTEVEAKAWSPQHEEPAAWPLDRTDAEPALQSPGAVGLRAELPATTLNAPVTFSVDSLHVTSPK